MFRKLVLALLPVAACLIAAADASAARLDVNGTGYDADADDWDAPKVAPNTQCQSLMLYLADQPSNASAARRYRFTGTCTINTAREGKRAAMRTVNVLVDAEYSPGMKRASERVLVQDPDFGAELSTWATCPTDPFVANGVVCTNKGMGANKWNKFVNVEDAPFARQRATQSQATAAVSTWASAKAKGAPATSFWTVPKLASVAPTGHTQLGSPTAITLNVTGGAGMCPAEVDFGDGKKDRLILWSPIQQPFANRIDHQYDKKGLYKVSVHSVAGCTGEGLIYTLVK